MLELETMKKVGMDKYLRRVACVLLLGLIGTTAVQAKCVALADNASSNYLTNQRQTIICLNNELGDRVRRTDERSQFDQLDQRLDRMQIQRRFDALPRPGLDR